MLSPLRSLLYPLSLSLSSILQVEWFTIPDSIVKSPGSQEKGKYTMKKTDMLDDKDLTKFRAIGLARHEFLDAMMTLSRMRYPESEVLAIRVFTVTILIGIMLNALLSQDPLYSLFCQLCEGFVVPYIWDGLEQRDAAKIKSMSILKV